MERRFNNVLVTGGAGFIGSNFIRHLFDNSDFKGRVINFDALTYAGNPKNLIGVENKYSHDRYFFCHGNILDTDHVAKVLTDFDVDVIVHFAAESHVDRSISGPLTFFETNVLGTFRLLETIRSLQNKKKEIHFHHVSTDEVFGSLGDTGFFTETTPYNPNSPYSASKAASDHFVRAYAHTYRIPVTLTNCSNNYGPYQFPEKMIPLMILNMIEQKPLPVYGDGFNIRDWLYVDDHNEAIWLVMRKAKLGSSYNIGGNNEWRNLDLIQALCREVASFTGEDADRYLNLISFIKDRPGHDRRYAISCEKIQNDLHWKPRMNFQEGLRKTVEWYINHRDWIDSIRSGEYRQWIADHYGQQS